MKFALVFLIGMLVFVSGCVQVKESKVCPECPKPNPWTKCIDGIHYRTNFKCGPETNYECVSYREYGACCAENWSCSEWSECQNGTRTRVCRDLNKCNTSRIKPKETKPC
ncbi:MAG: hypothetical protein DRP16_01555 [Candidatus Aenigmatarchaeota archaeon]|nr:MAG: hypothetical protein DRP16_01555 [Candidatus Aenigmarchaeota archaeon]